MIRKYAPEKTLLALAFLLAPIGCAAPISAGEMRRRSLFHALLWAWLVGLAVIWRWWGRPRSRPPSGG